MTLVDHYLEAVERDERHDRFWRFGVDTMLIKRGLMIGQPPVKPVYRSGETLRIRVALYEPFWDRWSNDALLECYRVMISNK